LGIPNIRGRQSENLADIIKKLWIRKTQNNNGRRGMKI